MSIKVEFDSSLDKPVDGPFGNQFSGVVGYRLAVLLADGGSRDAALQVVLESKVNWSSNTYGTGRAPAASRMSRGSLPIQGTTPYVWKVAVPHDGHSSNTLFLTNWIVDGSDSFISGTGIARTLYDIRPSNVGNWTAASTAPSSINLGDQSSGLLNVFGGAFRPVLDVGSPGKTLTYRTLRSNVDDPLAFCMNANVTSWTTAPKFKWHPQVTDAKGKVLMQDQPAKTLNHGGKQKALLFEELGGCFVSYKRWDSEHFQALAEKQAPANPTLDAKNIRTLLGCSMDEVLPALTTRGATLPTPVTSEVQERVTILFSDNVDFPGW